MYKFLIASFCVLMFIGCGSEKVNKVEETQENNVINGDQFSITGTIDDALLKGENRKVILSAQSQGINNEPVFSSIAEAEIDENNSFNLSGPWENFLACKLTVAGYEEVVIIENAPIFVDVKSIGDDYRFDFKGSLQTEQFVYLRSQIIDFQKKDQLLQNEIIGKSENPSEEIKKRYFQSKRDLQITFEESLKKKIDSLSPSYATFLSLSFLDPRAHQDFYFSQADKFYADIENHSYASKFVEDANRAKDMMTKIKVGDIAPDFELTTPEGEKVSLSSFRGKVILLDFWASWCGPCRLENPNLVKVFEKYKNDDFDILSVSLDKDRDAWVNAIKADGLVWNHVSDLGYWNSKVVGLYKIEGIPKTILIDKNGIILAQDLRGEGLNEQLRDLLGH